MTKTFAELRKQIAELEKEASAAKARELKEVIDNIKQAISHYGLTAEDLGFRKRAGGKTGAAKRSTKRTSGAAYRDESGNEWAGRGPRPKWLREALASGKSLSDFKVGAGAVSSAKRATTKAKKAGVKKAKPVVKYRDGTGNAWSGHGRQPQWFKDAIASGVSLEQLAA